MLQKARLCAYAESLVGITLTVFFNKGQGEVKKTLIRATFLLLERRILTPGGWGRGENWHICTMYRGPEGSHMQIKNVAAN